MMLRHSATPLASKRWPRTAVAMVAANNPTTTSAPVLSRLTSLVGSGMPRGTVKCISAAGTRKLTGAGRKRWKNSRDSSLPFCQTISEVMSPNGEMTPPALAATTMMMQPRTMNR